MLNAILLALTTTPTACQDAPDLTPRNVHLVARADVPGNTWTVQARWTTKVPCVGRLAHGSEEKVQELTEAEPVPCNNHRVDLHGLAWGEAEDVRIVNEADGEREDGEVTRMDAPRPPAETEAGSVELTVTNASDVPLPDCPVTVGLPFPEGALASAGTVRLEVGGEELIPQTRVLSSWPGNSVKWLVLDWQMDLAREDGASVTVRYGGKPAATRPALPDLVRGDANTIRVDTGALQLTLLGDGLTEWPGFVESRLTTSDGKLLTGRFADVEVEENGPYRAVVRFDGHHVGEDGEELFGYTLRFFFHRGKAHFRLDHVFANDHLDEQMSSIRSLDLVFPGELYDANVGTDGGFVSMKADERLFQDSDAHFTIDGAEGKRAPGWVNCTGGPAVVVRDFWQQWPKSLGLTEEGLMIGLCPEIQPADLYAGRDDEHMLTYHVRDGLHTFRRGLEKRHELWVKLEGGLDDEMRAMAAERVTAVAPPRWYADSGALGDLLPEEGEPLALYQDACTQNIGVYLERRDARREYGLMNYGDWYGERNYNWGNLEYDTHHGFLAQYLRSGDRRFLLEGEVGARHCMDIDVIHHANGQTTPPTWSGPRLPGQVWVHCMGHTGGYYPPEKLDMGVYAEGYSTNRGHIWSQGMWEYGCLTGDRRAWEVAGLVSDWAAGPQTTNFRFTNMREPGWMTILVMSAYRATGDPYYLNAARLMIDKLFEERDASPKPESGLRYRELVPGHCTCEEHHWGAAGFMAGVLMTGLKMYHQETGDEEVAEDIVSIARFCVDTMWEEESGLFRYTSCPKSSESASYGFILGNGIGFAANYADDARLRDVLKRYIVSTLAGFQGTGGGKTIGFYMCFAPYALSEVAKFPGESLGETIERDVRRANAPGLRRLACMVPNPDFELDVKGWIRRGGTLELDDADPRSGAYCGKLAGHFEGVNEYMTTMYGTPGKWELSWLEPGREYRLSAWLKVESLTEGTPAPDIRLSHRIDNQTQGSFMSGAKYDLTRMGEWQKLACAFTVPEGTTQAYLAVNTHSREPIDAVMYIDDWRIAPIEAPADLDPVHVLAPLAATGDSLTVTVPISGTYHVWVQAQTTTDEAADVAVSIGEREVGEARLASDVWEWVEVGEGAELSEGEHEARVTWPKAAEVKALYLTDEIVE